MQIPGKTMLASLGIFIGVIFFGAHIIVFNYNHAVAPDKPLVLMDWQVQEDSLKITLLGDTVQLPYHASGVRETWQSIRASLEHQVAEIEKKVKIVQQVVYEMKGWP